MTTAKIRAVLAKAVRVSHLLKLPPCNWSTAPKGEDMEQIIENKLNDLLAVLEAARISRDDRQRERAKASAEIEALNAERIAAQKRLAEAEYEIAASNGPVPTGPIPAEAEIAMIDRYIRIASVRLGIVDRKVADATERFCDAKTDVEKEWREVAIRHTGAIRSEWAKAALALRSLYCEYRVWASFFHSQDPADPRAFPCSAAVPYICDFNGSPLMRQYNSASFWKDEAAEYFRAVKSLRDEIDRTISGSPQTAIGEEQL